MKKYLGHVKTRKTCQHLKEPDLDRDNCQSEEFCWLFFSVDIYQMNSSAIITARNWLALKTFPYTPKYMFHFNGRREKIELLENSASFKNCCLFSSKTCKKYLFLLK